MERYTPESSTPSSVTIRPETSPTCSETIPCQEQNHSPRASKPGSRETIPAERTPSPVTIPTESKTPTACQPESPRRATVTNRPEKSPPCSKTIAGLSLACTLTLPYLCPSSASSLTCRGRTRSLRGFKLRRKVTIPAE